MTPTEILDALRQLPPAERLQVLEAALRMTREEMAGSAMPPQTEPEQKMAQARQRLYASLKEDEE